MYCKNCGKEIAEQQSFCKHCGDRAASGSSNRTKVLAIGALALAIAGGAGLAFFSSKATEPVTPPQPAAPVNDALTAFRKASDQIVLEITNQSDEVQRILHSYGEKSITYGQAMKELKSLGLECSEIHKRVVGIKPDDQQLYGTYLSLRSAVDLYCAANQQYLNGMKLKTDMLIDTGNDLTGQAASSIAQFRAEMGVTQPTGK